LAAKKEDFMKKPQTQSLLMILIALQVLQTYLLIEREARADTLRLDYCITMHPTEPPEQYLHVVAHPSPEAAAQAQKKTD
jgi:hypothetical protein